MKHIYTLATMFLLFSGVCFSQDTDKTAKQQISALETAIGEAKTNIPPGEEKKYYAALSDVENRKNKLKMMLKTPVEKRNDAWRQAWEENYSRAKEKLDKLK